MARERQTIAVGSGKGGVGKSLVAANIGIALAKRGRQVILVDADLGGANLHTFLNMDPPERTLSQFIQRSVESLPEVVVPTPIPNLSLISGARDLLEVANPMHQQKMRLLRHLGKLECNDLIIDLGAGTTYNVLDFFLFAPHGMLVLAPEPTSEENAYRFLKAAYLRRLRTVQNVYGIKSLLERAVAEFTARGLSTPRELVGTVSQLDVDAGRQVADEMARFQPLLVVNQVRGADDEHIGERIGRTCRDVLGISLTFAGSVPFDDLVWKAVRRHRPLLVDAPGCRAGRAIEAIVEQLLGGTGVAHGTEDVHRHFRRVALEGTGPVVPRSLTGVRPQRPTAPPAVVAAEPAPAEPEQSELALPPLELPQLDRPPLGAEDTNPLDGSVLQAVRKARGLTLDQVAEKTRIPRAKLQAIEDNDAASFAARVYLRGFVYQFAQFLGLDGERTARAYLQHLDRAAKTQAS